ncbi:MAG: N-acetylneuraminate synthase [Muribaculaceae bacterium]|nr:N-acetylneuraminate synthase [Muribaculaceae bacterium]
MDHVIVIAEAGVNHNADPEMARRMVVAAKEAGADFVKFQTAVPELVISSVAPKAEYQKEQTGDGESQLDMCRKLHFPIEFYRELKDYCREVGIGFMSTPFDLVSLRFLIELGTDYIKIPSGEITNLPFLREVAKSRIPTILSTGMSTLGEVERAVCVLADYPAPGEGVKRDEIIVLHCNTQYPTPFGDVNLLAMPAMGKALGLRYGYSDHTPGTEVPVAAVALGACVVEKHFTLDRSLPGPDHKASLVPDELRRMVTEIRHIEAVLGSPEKRVSPSERANIEVARKSLVAARDIRQGELLSYENIAVKRPGNGISPWEIDSVVGTRAKRDFPYDTLIEL